jgi:hypothetical protein
MTMPTYKGLTLWVPETNSEYRGYYEAAGTGALVVQRCTECDMLRGDIGAACPYCTSPGWEWQPVSGKGTIFSYGVVAHAINPAFSDWVPYPIVLVELDEQRNVPWRGGVEGEFVSLRLITNLVRADDPARPEDEDSVAIGRRVEVVFVPAGEGFALPQFRLTAEELEQETS